MNSDGHLADDLGYLIFSHVTLNFSANMLNRIVKNNSMPTYNCYLMLLDNFARYAPLTPN